MRRWRWPLVLSFAVLLGQLLRTHPLSDVVTGATPPDVRLEYPLLHIILAPLTLVADWLNGGSRYDLFGWVGWTLVVCAVVGLRVSRGTVGQWDRGVPGDDAAAPRRRWPGWLSVPLTAVLSLLVIAFVVYSPRPIPRLLAPPGTIVFDVHTHTTRSHDGRPWMTSAANAAWHARAGFDAAFVTDHNTNGAAAAWRQAAPAGGTRLLDGIELSLAGLHLLVLGTADSVDNRRWSASWDSTLALVRLLAAPAPARTVPPLLLASLPEYWRYHWGPDIGQLIDAGVGGFEVWTTSPKAMEFPPAARATLIARTRGRGLALAGATDMHGLGRTANVWNVAPLAEWRGWSDAALADSLIVILRDGRNRVLARPRWLPASRLDYVLALPVNLALVLRTASPAHALALLGWIWLPLLLMRRRAARAP